LKGKDFLEDVGRIPMFRRILLLRFSVWWRQQCPPNRWYPAATPNYIITQKLF